MVELAPDDKALLTAWTERFTAAEDGIHKHYRDTWTRFDKLYHGYKQLEAARANAAPKDRYPLVLDARNDFGHELHIPYAFAIVETVLPRLLSNRPRMLVLPRTEESERNVENMRALIDRQQNDIDYEIKVQEVAKSGLIYGLGIQKTYWKHCVVDKSTPVPASFALRAVGQKYALKTVTEKLHDGPVAEQVNIRHFFWDPWATAIDDARWVIHRTKRDTAYVLDKIASGTWNYAPDLKLEDLESSEGATRMRSADAGPLEAQRLPNPGARDTDAHEIWECHDRTTIVTICDRKWIVSIQPNDSYPGRLPFQCYRPTHVLNQFVGKGEIEPIEDLQLEMNMLRTHRRWNAEMVMHAAFFYNDGIVDPRRVKIGPGALIPVNGDPKDVLQKIEMGDVPFSSYREAQEIASDIERASGISDSTAGADAGAAQTATGIQLVQAAANARIQLKTRRAEVELIREGCRHWGALNQRYILDMLQVQVPAPPTPEQPDRTSAWLKLGPEQLAGEFDYEPEGGSTTPENIPQKRQDAQIKMAALGQMGGLLDARRMAVSILDDLGYKNPETYLAPDAHVPPGTLDLILQQLVKAGMDQATAQQLVEGSLNQALDAEQQQQQGPPASPQPPGEPQQQAA